MKQISSKKKYKTNKLIINIRTLEVLKKMINTMKE